MVETIPGTDEAADGNGLVYGFDVAEDGGASRIGWKKLEKPAARGRWRWLHLDRTAPRTIDWIRTHSAIPPLAAEALLMEDTRPRCTPMEGGTLIILRGVNLNPGADPEDMVSIRLWVTEHAVVSLRRQRVKATEDVARAIAAGRGPTSTGEFISHLGHGLSRRIAEAVNDLEEKLDDLEERSTKGGHGDIRTDLIELRRQAIPLRRYLAPQREVYNQFFNIKAHWMDDWERAQIRELAEHTHREVEDLDAVRERASLLNEELTNRVSEQINRNMYVLSIAATIFLPLTFVTGLLGMNVGGLPFTENWGFAAVLLGLTAVVVVAVLLLRHYRWM